MIDTLFDHLIWADARAHAALVAMPVGTAERSRAEAIYAHLVAAEHNWLARLTGAAPAVGLWPELDVAAAATLAANTGAALRAYVDSLGPAGLNQPVTYRNTSGHEFTNRVGDVLVHVALHGSYHRGQLALLARQGGAQPALTEYIAFLRAPEPHVPAAPRHRVVTSSD